ncbi:hypothetical protein CY35_16G003800 [Sphagnum magellanicum]|nr:hypothetical protein CY35_16G003800 [Sphagnum magellanicum]
MTTIPHLSIMQFHCRLRGVRNMLALSGIHGLRNLVNLPSAGAQTMRSCLSPADPSHILLLYLNICVSSDFSIFPGLEGGGLQNLFAQESQNNGGNPCSQVRERREPNSTTPVHPEEPSKNLAKYIVPPYSPTYAGIPSLFSPVHPFSPQCSSPYNNSRFNWQEKAGDRDHSHDGVISNLSPGDDESSESVEFSKEDLHHPTHWRGNTGKQRHSEREKRRRHKAGRNGDIKRESQKQYLRNKNTKDEEQKRVKWKKQEVSIKRKLSVSSSESGSSSSQSDKVEKEVCKKRKRAGQDADGNVTWTEESVRFLFETYNSIHQHLWQESNGQVKYQKKWTPILKAMQERFGSHFSKKQCQSKYWSVRRECSDYRHTSAKIAQSDPSWNPSIAGRELLKPKFYDVWFEVSGNNQAILPKGSTLPEVHLAHTVKTPEIHVHSSRLLGKEVSSSMHGIVDCGSAVKEMQQLMKVQLQASERREEKMKCRADLMMELFTQHMEHVEKRVDGLEESRQPQLYALGQVNLKLEKVLEGFSALNENLSTILYGIIKGLKS